MRIVAFVESEGSVTGKGRDNFFLNVESEKRMFSDERCLIKFNGVETKKLRHLQKSLKYLFC